MKQACKRMTAKILGLFLLLFLLSFGKEVLAIDAICKQIIIGCIRSGTFENFTLYDNGNWYGEASDNRVVYVDPNTDFDITLYAGGGYSPYVYALIIPGEAPIQKTGFTSYRVFKLPMGAVGHYTAQIDSDSGKIFTIEFKASDIRKSQSSERSLFASSPSTSIIYGEKYIYSPLLVESIVAGSDVIWHLSTYPEGMELDDINGKITWLPTEQQIGYHDTSLLVAVDDDKSTTEEQSWTIAVKNSPSKDSGWGICFISALKP